MLIGSACITVILHYQLSTLYVQELMLVFSTLSPFPFHSYENFHVEVIGSSQRDTHSPEISAIKKFKSMLRPAKRARNQENHEFDFIGMFLLFK